VATHPPMVLTVPAPDPPEASEAVDRSSFGPPVLAEVYGEHFAAVWRNLRRLGVADAALDDAAQDVFLVLHRRLGDFAGRSTLKTFLFGIVLRVARDHRRAARRHQARVARLAASVESLPRVAPPDETAERAQAVRVVRAVLDGLDDEQRAVFVLVELEQLTVKEAAAAAGLGLATCQRRLRAARAAFDAGVRGRLAGRERVDP
jgi:RNA polymerase sigma-70 factor (ECF subfamily)